MKLQGIELALLPLLGGLTIPSPASMAADSRAFAVTEIAPGVHVAIRPRPLEHPVDGNVTFVIGPEDVIVIDSGRTPSSAREAIRELRKLTSLPVRYLVNTHWHGDHQHGNATYREAFPGVEIVSQRATREDIATLGAASLEGQIRRFEDRPALEKWIASGRDENGRPLVPAERHRLRQLLSVPPNYVEELRKVRLSLPTITFDRELVIHQGEREVRIFSNGAGNTRGDAVIYLPRERVVVTGDLVVSTIPFMSMSYPRGWLARLDEVSALDWNVLVPGHGPVQRDRSALDLHRELLRSLIEQTDRAIRAGEAVDVAVASVDLSPFRESYSAGDSFLADEFDYRVTLNGPRDAYLEATSARARALASAVAAEASRLERFIPEAERTGFLADELNSALDALGSVGGDVVAGRTYLALRKLSVYQDMVLGAAFFYRHESAAKNRAEFDSLWRTVGPELAPGDLEEKIEQGRAAAVVRARAEIAINRIEPHYRAARLYARAGQQPGGLFYLGSARAALDFVRFCATLPHQAAGDPPDLAGLERLEEELSREALQAYGEADAATTHHRDFIRLDSALKEARELLRAGRRYGAAASLLEARLRLDVAGAPPGTAPDFDAAAYQARLFDPGHDHSLARELWERALEAAASTDPGEQTLAAVILSDVIPFYFDRLAASPAWGDDPTRSTP